MIYLDNTSEYSQKIWIPREVTTNNVTPFIPVFQSKDYTISQNGRTRIHPDTGYDAITGGSINVYVTAATGVTFEHLTATENDTYVATGDSAYSGVTVNVDLEGPFNSGYTSGHTQGMEDQKALLTSRTFTKDGTYTRENGYNQVTVDVISHSVITLTQEEYDALNPPRPDIIYLIKD